MEAKTLYVNVYCGGSKPVRKYSCRTIEEAETLKIRLIEQIKNASWTHTVRIENV